MRPPTIKTVCVLLAMFAAHTFAAGCYSPPKTGNPVVSTGGSGNAGNREKTGRPLDLAINGDGFFIVKIQSTGGFLFTRRASLSVASSGELVNEDGYILYPPVLVGDAKLITITPDGVVRARVDENDADDVTAAIMLARFNNPGGLTVDSIYRMPTESSGDPITGRPGTNGLGTLAVGVFEK